MQSGNMQNFKAPKSLKLGLTETIDDDLELLIRGGGL
jgi:hypothetical protein